MNASVAVVVIKDEKNNSFSWTTDFPPVLLTDELTVNGDQRDKCNNFGRVATRGTYATRWIKNRSILFGFCAVIAGRFCCQVIATSSHLKPLKIK